MNKCSLQEAIQRIRNNQDKLESKLGKSQVEELLFNLEEITLDTENLARDLTQFTSGDMTIEDLQGIFDSFQYSSIPHIVGHLETIEGLLEQGVQYSEIASV